MNWNRWGRILLFANLGLSLMFAFWALGVYRHPMDFPSESETRKKEIEGYKKVLAGTGDGRGAEARWQLAQHNLKAAEARRPELVKWYAERLEALRSGPGQPQALVYDKAGKLQIEPQTGRPVLAPVLHSGGQPVPGLSSLKNLGQNYTQAQNDLNSAVVESDKALDMSK